MGNFFRRLFGDTEQQEIHVDQPPPVAGIEVRQQPSQPADQEERVEPYVVVPAHNQPDDPDRLEPRPGEDPELPFSQRNLLHSQPVGTFKYLPDDYNKPNFEQSNIQEVNDILTEVERIFMRFVVGPRKEIDTTLRSFRTKTGKSPDAALTTCFEIWKSEAFPNDEQNQKPAFKVRLNNAARVMKILPNEREQFLTPEVNDITEEMSVLLDCCHEFLGEREDTVERLQEQIEKYNEVVKHNRSKKADLAKGEMESLIPEVDRLVQQVDDLLTDIKAAVSNKDMVVAKPATWRVASLHTNS